MDRPDVTKRRGALRNGGIDRRGRTAAASALATGCLAVIALWRSTAANAAAGGTTRR